MAAQYPAHWGEPPMMQTRDLRPLPEPFGGMGSGTLARWITEKQAADAGAGLIRTQSSQERQRAAQAEAEQQRAEAEAAAAQREIDRVQAQIAAASAGGGGGDGGGGQYPAHWGEPPRRQTRDLRPLPEPFGGMGSGTLARWIGEKQAADAAGGVGQPSWEGDGSFAIQSVGAGSSFVVAGKQARGSPANALYTAAVPRGGGYFEVEINDLKESCFIGIGTRDAFKPVAAPTVPTPLALHAA